MGVETAAGANRSAATGPVYVAQGAYYAVTGIWPLLHRRSFEAITGPKVDFWLVRTVGAVLTVVGIALALAGRQGRDTPEVRVLALGSAAALTAVDVVYVARGRIRPTYLLDAAAEVGLVVGWLLLRRRGSAAS